MSRNSKQRYRFASGFLLLILALQSLLSLACSEIAEELITGRNKTPLQKFYDKHGRNWEVRKSPAQDRVTNLIGGTTRPYAGEPREKALQFLRETAAVFGLQPDLSDLQVLNSRVDSFSANVEFQQVYKGLPVENGRIQINFDGEGRVLHVISSYAPTAGATENATQTREQTITTATEEFLRTTPVYNSKLDEQEQSDGLVISNGKMELAERPKVDDVYFIRDDRLRRAYRTLINAVVPFGIKEVTTDANTGEVLQIRDFVYSAFDGSGRVFLPNPVNSLRDNTFSDTSTTHPVPDTSPNPYYVVSLLGLHNPGDGPFILKGPYVVVEELQDPQIAPATANTLEGFAYQRNANGFEDVMVYYHIDRMQRYIQQLGFTNVMNRQIRVDAHASYGADNSQYVSTPDTRGNGYLLFGQGGVDDAEDGDVIAHEYGHAIQDHQAPGKYSVYNGYTRSMGEGFGDYWAVSSFYNETLANGHDVGCVMEWDKAPNCLRRVDLSSATAYSYKASASYHLNGQIWSRTLFRILQQLGKETADRLILRSHFNVSHGPNFVQGAEAILTADRQLFNGSHVGQLCRVFYDQRISGVNSCSGPSPAPPQQS